MFGFRCFAVSVAVIIWPDTKIPIILSDEILQYFVFFVYGISMVLKFLENSSM